MNESLCDLYIQLGKIGGLAACRRTILSITRTKQKIPTLHIVDYPAEHLQRYCVIWVLSICAACSLIGVSAQSCGCLLKTIPAQSRAVYIVIRQSVFAAMEEIRCKQSTNANDSGQLDAIMRVTAHSSVSSWRCLYNCITKNHTWPFALAMLFSVVSGMIIPALAVFLGMIFEAFTKYGGQSISGSDLVKQTSAYGKGLVALGCISGLFNAIFFMCWIIFGELQARGARGETFDKMLDKNMAWIDTRSFGVEALVSQLQMYVFDIFKFRDYAQP